MHNRSCIACGRAVRALRLYSGKVRQLPTRCVRHITCVVGKYRAYTADFTSSFPAFFHGQNSIFTSVIALFIPIIHTTYKEQEQI